MSKLQYLATVYISIIKMLLEPQFASVYDIFEFLSKRFWHMNLHIKSTVGAEVFCLFA